MKNYRRRTNEFMINLLKVAGGNVLAEEAVVDLKRKTGHLVKKR